MAYFAKLNNSNIVEQVIVVNDIPRTKNGKIVELAVKNIIEGNEIKNLSLIHI